MKIILLKDVPKVGHKYDIKNVPDGHALNFLIPQKLAEIVTPANLARIEKMKEDIRIERETEEKSLIESLGKLKNIELVVKSKANEQGHLFSGIGSKEISDELKSSRNIDISSEFILLPKPIKNTGRFEIQVVIKDKKGVFQLVVEKI